ncbi:exopolyphosphatase [Lentinula aff. detonsa]|nr:exopolyphosphatase [Lentinula aff. detonsa]
MSVLNRMYRLSTFVGIPKIYEPQRQITVPESTLADFLSFSREQYLHDVRNDGGKAKEWTLVMGNEAGDLDTIASSIAFAWLRTKVLNQPSISLLQMDRNDLDLRAENLHALELAGVSRPKDQLLFVADLIDFHPFPSREFALVDHNRLSSTFTPEESPVVVAIVDHHADENLYVDSAEPRIIAPSGSCASHITNLMETVDLPPELATLLLSAILIDTDGLKPGGKAIDVDRKAADYLAPKSTFASSVSALQTNDTTPSSTLYEVDFIRSLSEELSTKKNDVSHLGPRDLLRRDYKQYEFILPWHPAKPTIRAGLSTVPVKLEEWAADGKLETEGDAWMKEKGLHVLGVLTAYRGATKGKRKREMAWLVRTVSPPTDGFDFDALMERLCSGLEADPALELKEHKKFMNGTLKDTHRTFPQLRVRIYMQNPHATRKVTAPALKSIMEAQN